MDLERNADRIFCWAFFLLLALQLLTLNFSPLGLSPDEAHYWEWSRRLDISYYSKGPVVAYLIWCGRQLFGDTEFAVRLPALVCSALFSLSFYRFMRREFSAAVALLAWCVARSMLIIGSTAFLMTTDAPTLLFWWLALASGYCAIKQDLPRYWISALFWVGVCVLTKYTAGLLVVCFLAALIVTPSRRWHLRSSEFWCGVVLCALVVSPILLWNAQHDWVNFAHNSNHLVSDKGVTFRPRYFLELIGGQFGLVGPIILILMLTTFRQVASRLRTDPIATYLLFVSVPLLVFCLLISLTKSVYANWPLPAYLGALVLLGQRMQKESLRGRFATWCVRGVSLNIILLVLAHLPLLGITLGIPPRLLPTKKMVGWNEFAQSVDVVRKQVDSVTPSDLFLLTDYYGTASILSFYLPDHPQVYCANIGDRRMNQYDIWGGLERMKGKSGLLILPGDQPSTALVSHFASLAEVPDFKPVEIRYDDIVLKSYQLFVGTEYDGSPPLRPTKR